MKSNLFREEIKSTLTSVSYWPHTIYCIFSPRCNSSPSHYHSDQNNPQIIWESICSGMHIFTAINTRWQVFTKQCPKCQGSDKLLDEGCSARKVNREFQSRTAVFSNKLFRPEQPAFLYSELRGPI